MISTTAIFSGIIWALLIGALLGGVFYFFKGCWEMIHKERASVWSKSFKRSLCCFLGLVCVFILSDPMFHMIKDHH